MTYDSAIHHRRSIRLRGYDYSSAGAYFVTMCAQNRELLFGDIVEGSMILNGAGMMVQTVWDEIPSHYPGIEIDEFIVMPNHLHGIIIIVGAAPRGRPGSGQLSLPDIAHRFKSMTTKRHVDGVKQNGGRAFPGKLWQRNYWEHIVRNESGLNRIREYIRNNPARWESDRLYMRMHDDGQVWGDEGQARGPAPTVRESTTEYTAAAWMV